MAKTRLSLGGACGCMPPTGAKESVTALCPDKQVKHIARVDGKVVIIFSDCTYLEADASVLDSSICSKSTPAPDDIKARLDALEASANGVTELRSDMTKIQERLGNLVEVKNFNNDVEYLAFPPNP